MSQPEVVEVVPVESEKQFDPTDLWDDKVVPIPSIGDGLRLIKEDRVNFSKEFATKILELEEFKPDRSLVTEHVNRLVTAMKRGTFRWEQLQIIVCKLNGKEYRMNGQHSAWARIYWEEAPHNLPVKLLRYHANTENDMRLLYSSIDRNKPRTKGNVITSYLFASDIFPDISKRVIRHIAEGFSYWKWGIKTQSRHDGDEISYLLQTEYNGLALKIAYK